MFWRTRCNEYEDDDDYSLTNGGRETHSLFPFPFFFCSFFDNLFLLLSSSYTHQMGFGSETSNIDLSWPRRPKRNRSTIFKLTFCSIQTPSKNFFFIVLSTCCPCTSRGEVRKLRLHLSSNPSTYTHCIY